MLIVRTSALDSGTGSGTNSQHHTDRELTTVFASIIAQNVGTTFVRLPAIEIVSSATNRHFKVPIGYMVAYVASLLFLPGHQRYHKPPPSTPDHPPVSLQHSTDRTRTSSWWPSAPRRCPRCCTQTRPWHRWASWRPATSGRHVTHRPCSDIDALSLISFTYLY